MLELFSEEIPLPGNPEAMLTCGRTRTVDTVGGFLLQFVDTVQSFYVMYVILIFFYAVTIVGLYQICCLLFGRNAFTAVQGVIISTYLPYAFLINNIYGDHIGYAFAVVAVWMALLLPKIGKLRYSVLCGIARRWAGDF